MKYEWNILGEAGLQFFGKMSASISHEIKNTLAIINENAGLLEDFTIMVDKGIPLDPERLKTLAKKVMIQIRRANGIVKNMNAFAHSVDESVKRVELGELVELVTMLAERFAVMRGVALEPTRPMSPVMITTHPFFLKNLVWLCLNFAMNATGEAKTVALLAEETETGAKIRFARLRGLDAAPAERFPSERERALLEALNAVLAIEAGIGELVISLPKDIRGDPHKNRPSAEMEESFSKEVEI